MAKSSEDDERAELVWEGDSREIARTYPKKIRLQLGQDIERVRYGEMPFDGKPMKSIGAGVFEHRREPFESCSSEAIGGEKECKEKQISQHMSARATFLKT